MTENVYRSENIGCNAFLLTNFIEKERKKNHVHLLERESDIIQLKDLITFFNKKIEIIDFPAWDCLPYGHISPGKSITSKRFSSLVNILTGSKKPKIFLVNKKLDLFHQTIRIGGQVRQSNLQVTEKGEI